jgi:hypothetical protein
MKSVLDRRPVAAVSLVVAIVLGKTAPVSAQMIVEETQDEPAWLDSGRNDNPTNEELVVILGVITSSGGPWMRVHIGGYDLGRASYLTLTALDGHVQRLDNKSLPDWHFWSAMFNGSEVEVSLHVAPGDVGVFVQIDQVRSPRQEASLVEGGIAAICNDFDDRVAFGDPRVGRIGGCTGWLVSNGAVLTAGHCLVGPGTLMEFNVPPSLPNGVSVQGSPNDQYPVGNTILSENGGVGADWMVLGLNPNGNGVRAHIVQGFFFHDLAGPGN